MPWVQEFQVRRPDGALRWIRGSATPQREPDGQVLWHGYFEDLTEWHALARAERMDLAGQDHGAAVYLIFDQIKDAVIGQTEQFFVDLLLDRLGRGLAV